MQDYNNNYAPEFRGQEPWEGGLEAYGCNCHGRHRNVIILQL